MDCSTAFREASSPTMAGRPYELTISRRTSLSSTRRMVSGMRQNCPGGPAWEGRQGKGRAAGCVCDRSPHSLFGLIPFGGRPARFKFLLQVIENLLGLGRCGACLLDFRRLGRDLRLEVFVGRRVEFARLLRLEQAQLILGQALAFLGVGELGASRLELPLPEFFGLLLALCRF